MLTSVEVTNFKSIAHALIQMGKQNVVVGPNGVGKSNLIDAINFVRDAASDGLDHAVTKRHGINSIRRWSKTRPFNISIKMSMESNSGHGDYKISISSAGGNFAVLEEEGNWFGTHPFMPSDDKSPVWCRFKRDTNKPVKFDIPKSPFKSLKFPPTPTSEAIISQFNPNSISPHYYFFKGLFDELVSCGAYSIYPNKIREPQSISNSNMLSDDGTNLASIIRQMRTSANRASRDALTAAIQQVLPIVNEIRIESAGGFYVPVFRVKENPSSQAHDLNMSQISDGTLRMLGMLTAFYQPHAPRRITLEEPEQMVHPGLLPILVDAASDYTEEDDKRQFVLTTHSPTLLDLFEPENVISTSFQGGISSFSRLSERQINIVKDRLFTIGELLTAEGLAE